MKHPFTGQWLPFRFVEGTMLHELAHNKEMVFPPTSSACPGPNLTNNFSSRYCINLPTLCTRTTPASFGVTRTPFPPRWSPSMPATTPVKASGQPVGLSPQHHSPPHQHSISLTPTFLHRSVAGPTDRRTDRTDTRNRHSQQNSGKNKNGEELKRGLGLWRELSWVLMSKRG